ncbi:pathogenicity island protein [Mammaliicoccus vitulinus]|uniref:pathogenicity island protein n=1 Tax=Mammaliicoccus vitulinus TaxID=71237 RepID=UPI002DBE3F7E|nr:pathogenicity island protein [Mammaliicoccus vitulinus]MEB7657624.1 pathogenicity island protein [Mammaliicoccus vitulinus]
MNKNLIKQKVLEFIDGNDMTTYAQIESVFEECDFDFKGYIKMTSQVKPAGIFWDGWNKEACSIVRELQDEKKIKMDICPIINYMVDGTVMKLPVAKNLNFKRDHWIPVGFLSTKNNLTKEVN